MVKVSSYIPPCGLLKALYTLLTDRPVQSNNISTSLGRIQPCYNYCVKIIHTQILTLQILYLFIQRTTNSFLFFRLPNLNNHYSIQNILLIENLKVIIFKTTARNGRFLLSSHSLLVNIVTC